MTDDNNQVTLTGRVSSEPESRILPSGDEVVSFRLIVRRGVAARRRSKQVVDTIDCSVWSAAVRRSVLKLAPGTEVTVRGELRRRFSRGGAGVISRVTVDVDTCRKVARAAVPSDA